MELSRISNPHIIILHSHCLIEFTPPALRQQPYSLRKKINPHPKQLISNLDVHNKTINMAFKTRLCGKFPSVTIKITVLSLTVPIDYPNYIAHC